MKKQISILAFLGLMLVQASATTVSIQTPDNSITVHNDSTENVGITVISEDYGCTDMFEDTLGDSGSISTHVQVNIPPFTSYNYTWHSDKYRFKDLFSDSRSFINSIKSSFPILFHSWPFPMFGITFIPILVILLIISCAIALSIIGKRSKEKEIEKRNHTDKHEYTQNSRESKNSNQYQKSGQTNEKKNKGLAVIICGVLLLILSKLFHLSWFITIGAFALIIIGIVNYLTSLSDNSSKRP